MAGIQRATCLVSRDNTIILLQGSSKNTLTILKCNIFLADLASSRNIAFSLYVGQLDTFMKEGPSENFKSNSWQSTIIKVTLVTFTTINAEVTEVTVVAVGN